MATFRKLGRPVAYRKAMLRNLVTGVLAEGRVTTVVTRTKETRRLAEKTTTLDKRGNLHARRQALAYIYDEDTVTRLSEEIVPRYTDRSDGYTRILEVGPRHEDSAEMATAGLV